MNSVTRLFKALSDDTRLRIFGLLQEGELCVCDLMAVLELPQSTVSRHLAYLRNSGVVADRREGVWIHYRLADDRLRGDALTRDLLSLLGARVGGLPDVRRDRAVLRKHLQTKKSAVCR